MLYLVPTPIGNLVDITIRAIEVLKTVDLVLAEDTRQSIKLFKRYEIDTRVKSFHAHNEHASISQLIEQMKAGQSIAMISDAGSPGISDPGYLLVLECHKAGVAVSALPGATALVPALTASGLPSDKFHFEGFLPHKKGRQTRWKYLSELNHTFILYESPYRLLKCITEVIEYCGPNREVCLARELSKIYEEILLLPAQEMHDELAKRGRIKGEIVVVVAGVKKKKRKNDIVN